MSNSKEKMSEKPDKKKTLMTSEDANRIKKSDTDEDFKERADKAAKGNKQAQQ